MSRKYKPTKTKVIRFPKITGAVTDMDCILSEELHMEYVALRPIDMIKLGIGTKDQFKDTPLEMDGWQIWGLNDMQVDLYRNTVGPAPVDKEFCMPLARSKCKMYAMVEINGKYFKLNSSEMVKHMLFMRDDFPTVLQIPVFQRLLKGKQITLEDLAAADIDNTIYKQLMINQELGEQAYLNKLNELRVYAITGEENEDIPIEIRKELHRMNTEK